MVVDLEGIVTENRADKKKMVLLTDPAIHCEDITRFTPLNLGENGMNCFLKSHKCNKFCEALRLQK